MRFLFAVTMFVSATLLFLVQPMVGKMVLPKLGGTPAVWNTCMVFFQALLLAGYGYAHLLTTWLSPRRQVAVHLLVLAAPLAALPIGVPEGAVPPADANPIPWLLAALLTSVGLPFFVLSTSAPLLQKWFSGTGDVSARDPYFLYAASNLGSMLALLGYPALVEPNLTLKASRWLSQSWLWAAGYGMLVLLTIACARIFWRGNPTPPPKPTTTDDSDWIPDPEKPALGRQLRWVALAFVPSSLMLGATTYITLDIAALPLLWVIPLALYLLSFILVFARWPNILHTTAVLAMPLVILLLVFIKVSDLRPQIIWTILVHLTALFLTALVCHGELARSRPSTKYLTQFYLLMSLGGVLGGVFNALIAPLVFNSVLEYPIVMVLGCLLLPSINPNAQVWITRWLPYRWRYLARPVIDIVMAGLLGLLIYGLCEFFFVGGSEGSWTEWSQDHVMRGIGWLVEKVNIKRGQVTSMLIYGVPELICYLFIARPLRFGLGVGAILLACGTWDTNHQASILLQQRSFFGVLKVQVVGDTHSLLHGTTLHGKQIRSPERRFEAQTYYHTTGPIGQVFKALQDAKRKEKLAFIGLGSGTLATYGESGQGLTFYDIDPAVVRIAKNPEYFTYLQDCRANWNIVLGDARIRLAEAPDHEYGLLVVDAFSSDAIPIHLITREAIELYFRKLNDHGILAVHISNRHLELQPVLGNLAEDLHLVALAQNDYQVDDETQPGKSSSEWVLLARRNQDFVGLDKDNRWEPAEKKAEVGVWTDDYSNLLSVFVWWPHA